MQEIVYSFHNYGGYLPDKTTAFQGETHFRLIIQPHSFELEISGEVLRRSSCDGYMIEVSHKGEVWFYDDRNHLLAAVKETKTEFAEVRFLWKQDQLHLQFGHAATVDYYPHCDGEHDRWGTEWVSQYEVSLNTITKQVDAFAC